MHKNLRHSIVFLEEKNLFGIGQLAGRHTDFLEILKQKYSVTAKMHLILQNALPNYFEMLQGVHLFQLKTG